MIDAIRLPNWLNTTSGVNIPPGWRRRCRYRVPALCPEAGKLPPWISTRPSAAGPWSGASPPIRSIRRGGHHDAGGSAGAERRQHGRDLMGRPPGADQTARCTGSPRPTRPGARTSARSPGLRRAPVILLAYASAEAYVARYAEPDKAASGPGAPRASARHDAAEWPVPYWMGDAAFGVMTVLLCAVDAGLGACVLGNFRGEKALAERPGRAPSLAPLLRRPAGPPRRRTTTLPARWTAPSPIPTSASTGAPGEARDSGGGPGRRKTIRPSDPLIEVYKVLAIEPSRASFLAVTSVSTKFDGLGATRRLRRPGSRRTDSPHPPIPPRDAPRAASAR